MQKIISLLRKKPRTKAKIDDLTVVERGNIQVSESVRRARKALSKAVGLLGYQYEYLCGLASTVGEIGVGLENAPKGSKDVGAVATIRRFGGLIKKDGFYRLNTKKATPEVRLLFDHMFFPIVDTTETQMRENIKKWGYEDIADSTWFCHSPISGKPCGLCRPCEEKMASGMSALLPEIAKRRFKKAKKWNFLGSKLSRTIKNAQIALLSHIKRQSRRSGGSDWT